MNATQRKMAAELRLMSSEEAASWLMNRYPIDSMHGDALLLIAHRSWERQDQLRLARYYFRGIPFASSAPYEVFAKSMGLKTLIAVVRENIPENRQRRQLLRFLIEPTLRAKTKSERDTKLIDELVTELVGE